MTFTIITVFRTVSDKTIISTLRGVRANVVKPKLWHMSYGTFQLYVVPGKRDL